MQTQAVGLNAPGLDEIGTGALGATLYTRTDDQGKRLAHQALTDGIEISEDERATIKLAEPFAALAPTPASTDVRCSSTSEIVELTGLEPVTPTLPVWCATSCAIAPV